VNRNLKIMNQKSKIAGRELKMTGVMSISGRLRRRRRRRRLCTRLPFRRPLVDVNAAKAVTGFDDERLLQEIEVGRILWAFNLGTGARNHVAILANSLASFLRPELAQPESVEAVADLVLPAYSRVSGNVRATELQFAFNLASDQVMKLMRAGLLVESHRSKRYQGRGGSALITRASVVQFLKARRFC